MLFPLCRMPFSLSLHVVNSYKSFKSQPYEILPHPKLIHFFLYAFISPFLHFSFMHIHFLCLPHCNIGQKLCVYFLFVSITTTESLSLIYTTYLNWIHECVYCVSTLHSVLCTRSLNFFDCINCLSCFLTSTLILWLMNEEDWEKIRLPSPFCSIQALNEVGKK